MATLSSKFRIHNLLHGIYRYMFLNFFSVGGDVVHQNPYIKILARGNVLGANKKRQ